MKQKVIVVFIALLGVMWSMVGVEAAQKEPVRKSTTAGVKSTATYAGSKSCRECHERFYGLWSGSMHGLAMQPYSENLAKEKLTPQKAELSIGKQRYRAEIGSGAGYVLEKGADGKEKRYRIEYALGGKNVFYFLTPLDIRDNFDVL